MNHGRRGLRYQRSLLDGFYMMPESAGTKTTVDAKDAREDQLAELPAPGFLTHQEKSPVELPADEITPVAAPPVPQPASPTPLLPIPRPRSPNTRKASPLLALPPVGKRTSYGSSMESASIEIAYVPSHPDDVDRNTPEPLEVSTCISSARIAATCAAPVR